ncbi:hypothetical protein [Cerasicoccus arenae]|uniref:TonB C-terminal domain-containing protein n=1 Tax=Cerasicoccus arenae TaxID=424488 RepID=A0A8J3DFR3_9BACT|nr:hypothetical protein [Cerasicoccus arenae]MBK1859009.1 hypothetical protein [Cerasicoccus arenae]GHB94682.1 hypothetical protein GCM10007047_07750 [Cerasicoccus arenae]
MSVETPTPPPASPPPRNEWPRWTDDKAGDKMRRVSVPLGLAVTVIIHLLAVWVFPWDEIGIIEKEKPKPNPPLEVEFLPPPPALPEFVPVNPMAPEEKPEDTDKISSQDQVAAQEVPDPTQDSDTPKVDGEMLDASNIVTGDLTTEPGPPSPEVMSDPSPALPPSPEEQQQAENTEAPPQEEKPSEEAPTEAEKPEEMTTDATEPQYLDQPVSEEDPGIEEIKAIEMAEAPEAEEGILVREKPGEAEIVVEETVEKTAQPERADQDRLEVYMEEVVVSEAATSQPTSEPRPQARPRLNFVQSTSGPLKMEQRSSNRVGAIEVDAKFDKFGAYLQRMIEAIDLQWQLMVRESSTIMAELGSRVVVRYTINQQGEIINMEVVFSSASRSGTAICVEAIQSRAPFGVWTKEMAQTLGESQSITIRYYFR